MSYLDDLLGEGEAVIFTTRQHGFVLFARVVAELILLILLGAAVYVIVALDAFRNERAIQWVGIVAGILAVIVILSAIKDFLRWQNDQYLITDRRVIQIKGVFNKSVLDSSLEKINDVELQQSFVGRMFDFGTIEILTASEEAINRMDNIASPLQFKRAMQDARARYDGYLRGPAPAQSQFGTDVHGVLEQLASLRDRGILSDAEFEAKKREILSRI